MKREIRFKHVIASGEDLVAIDDSGLLWIWGRADANSAARTWIRIPHPEVEVQPIKPTPVPTGGQTVRKIT